jgi:four helix bundle protein
MQDYRNLKVWQRAHEMTLRLYRMTTTFPPDERYGLTSQIRRAAASIPANIAEGSARNSDKDFARFVHIAMGSAAELDYHLLLAHDLDFMDSKSHQDAATELSEIRRMLNAFSQKLTANGS